MCNTVRCNVCFHWLMFKLSWCFCNVVGQVRLLTHGGDLYKTSNYSDSLMLGLRCFVPTCFIAWYVCTHCEGSLVMWCIKLLQPRRSKLPSIDDDLLAMFPGFWYILDQVAVAWCLLFTCLSSGKQHHHQQQPHYTQQQDYHQHKDYRNSTTTTTSSSPTTPSSSPTTPSTRTTANSTTTTSTNSPTSPSTRTTNNTRTTATARLPPPAAAPLHPAAGLPPAQGLPSPAPPAVRAAFMYTFYFTYTIAGYTPRIWNLPLSIHIYGSAYLIYTCGKHTFIFVDMGVYPHSENVFLRTPII